MDFDNKSEFNKEFKELHKKYRTLQDDLSRLKRFLETCPRGFPPIVFRASNTGVKAEIYIVKRFRCKALKHKGSRSGIRIVYAYLPEQDRIEFVEIYYKEKDDRGCDKKRILRYYK